MQTVLVVQSSAAGLVFLNGRLAGEVDSERPLTLPVSPFGAHFLELRPFSPGYLPLAMRLPLSRGIPLIGPADKRCCAAVWPGGVIEVELIPESLSVRHTPRPLARLEELSLFFSDAPSVLCEGPAGPSEYSLPEGALLPEVSSVPSGLLLIGRLSAGGQYAAVLSRDGSQLMLSVTGKHISITEDGSVLRVLHAFGDRVGHASLETWAFTPQGWQRTLSEPMWEHGAPLRPASPEETAISAIEAAQLGLGAEAAAYFAPSVSSADVLRRAAAFDGCVPLRYPLPDGEPAVGLMRLKDNVLSIIPARYSAIPGGNTSAWQLTRLEFDEDA